MSNKKTHLILSLTIFLFLITNPLTHSFIGPDEFESDENIKRDLRIAVLFQGWDYMDLLLRTFVEDFYKIRFSEIEKKYNIECNIYFFWDFWGHGDVQDGKLEDLDINIAFGSGGVGAFYTLENYREKIKEFVSGGGGLILTCGDVYLGILGAINLPDDYEKLLNKLFGFEGLTPSMKIVNVYFDASPFTEHFNTKYRQNNLYILIFLLTFFLSYADVYISDNTPFGEKYKGDTIKIMESGSPMVGNNKSKGLFLVGVYTNVMSPYNSSLFKDKYAIVADYYGEGRIILSSVHPEISIGNAKAHNIFYEMILWVSGMEKT